MYNKLCSNTNNRYYIYVELIKLIFVPIYGMLIYKSTKKNICTPNIMPMIMHD